MSRLRAHLYTVDTQTHSTLVEVGQVLRESGISADRRHGGASSALRWIVADWLKRGGASHVKALERARREGLPCPGGRWSVSAACRMIVRGWHARIIAEAVELAGGAADAAAPAAGEGHD